MAFMNKLPFSKRSLPARVIISYIVDYVIIIALFVAFWALDAVEPFHQHFALQNYTLQYPYAVKERVPIPLALFIAVLCPAGIIAIYTLILDGIFSHHKEVTRRSWTGKYRLKDRLWELNCGILGLLLASGTAFVITSALKNVTGKPRPDLIDRCQPKPGSKELELASIYGLSNSTICTQEDHAILKDGFRSFPSGHSSSAWGGLFYLSLYLAGKLHLMDNRGEVWKTFIVLTPTLAAALIALSRIQDARHHPFDVISGSMLGALCAFVAYRQYFPSLSEPWKKGRAYPIRSWGTIASGPSAEHTEREVARDQGVEPFRTQLPTFGSRDVEPEQGNVFRAQVAVTDRLRQQHSPGAPRHDVPYSAPGDLRPRGGRQGDDWDTSSDEDAQREFELQRPYGGERQIAGPRQPTEYGASSAPPYVPPPAAVVEPHPSQTTI